MKNTPCQGDFPPLNAGQIRELIAALRDGFGSNLSPEPFNGRLMTFLEDVRGHGAAEASSMLIESASSEHVDFRP